MYKNNNSGKFIYETAIFLQSIMYELYNVIHHIQLNSIMVHEYVTIHHETLGFTIFQLDYHQKPKANPEPFVQLTHKYPRSRDIIFF